MYVLYVYTVVCNLCNLYTVSVCTGNAVCNTRLSRAAVDLMMSVCIFHLQIESC